MTVHPKQREHLVVREAGQEIAVYDPSTGKLLQLNATAFAIWQACDGGTSIEEITDALILLTGRAPSDLMQEVITTVEALITQGLLERG